MRRVTLIKFAIASVIFGSIGGTVEARATHWTSGVGGYASWYGGSGLNRHTTASGEPLNPEALTAAHRFWPFGTRVRVTNNQNGRSVVVRINDRGPFAAGRVIDLTRASARAIGILGIARVSLARL